MACHWGLTKSVGSGEKVAHGPIPFIPHQKVPHHNTHCCQLLSTAFAFLVTWWLSLNSHLLFLSDGNFPLNDS